MERNALEKFQDQRNVILFTNYLLIYFHAVNRIHYESPWLRLIDFNIFQVMTVCIYCNPVAIDLNQPTCDGALRKISFFTIQTLILIGMFYAVILDHSLKCVTIIFKNLATQGIQLTQKSLYEELKTSTSKTLQVWRTVSKNV